MRVIYTFASTLQDAFSSQENNQILSRLLWQLNLIPIATIKKTGRKNTKWTCSFIRIYLKVFA
jgi:hypothetical protein